MDFEKIEFNDWQIEKMRSALRKYRSLHTNGGRLPSWAKVRDSIAFSDSNLDKYSAEKAELAFKSEALRRFSLNINRTLGIERMRDIARFLHDETLFNPEDFQEDKDDLAHLLALQEFLSNDFEWSGYPIRILSGTLKYAFPSKPGTDEVKTITLHFIPDASKKFVRVEEIIQSVDVAAKRRNDALRYRKKAKDSEFIRINRRKGYGFPVTRLCIMHVFLDGIVPGDRMTYIQAGELHEDFAESGIFLMRNGAATGRDGWAKDIYYAEPIVLPNIYRFMPNKSEEEQEPKQEAKDGYGSEKENITNPTVS